MNKSDVINILEDFNPVSVFLYGSRARNDFLKKSDYEIGVLFNKKNYVNRSEIQKKIKDKNIKVYPFNYEDFLKHKIDTPFQKSIYLYELIVAGKTISGKKVIENMKKPSIKVIDLIQRIRFDIGMSLASVFSFRQKDYITSNSEFYKSCLFGLRCLEILKLKKFPTTYDEIYKLSNKLNLGEYSQLIKKAYNLRKKESKLDSKFLFKNISFLNEFVESKIMNYFNKNGNKILLN